jgi:hypothetical protein
VIPYQPLDSDEPPPEKTSWVRPLLTVAALVAVVVLIHHIGGVGVFAILIFIVPIAFLVLIVRALLRVGDKRPPPVIVQQPVSGPPPGWYVDPAGLTRWYDGQRWTEHVKPGDRP